MKIFLIVNFILMSFFNPACEGGKTANQIITNKENTTNQTTSGKQNTENRQIFELDAARNLFSAEGAKPAKLDDADFGVIDEVLSKAVEDYNAKQKSEPNKIKSLESYKRQIVPYLNANGEKEVWINLFCSASGVDWRKVIVSVDDGGSCYFELKINLVNRQALSMMVNGSA